MLPRRPAYLVAPTLRVGTVTQVARLEELLVRPVFGITLCSSEAKAVHRMFAPGAASRGAYSQAWI